MKINNQCPLGGDTANDCADCVCTCDFHFVDGECVQREKGFYKDLLMEQQEQM